MVSRINALLLASLLLTACGSSGEAEGEPSYPAAGASSQAGSGGTDQGSAGTAGTTQFANAGAGGTASEPTSVECEFRSPYRMVATLTAGDASCAAGAEFEGAALQGRDEDACTGTFCTADGRQCIEMACDRGNPVPECSVTMTNGNGCTYVWTMVQG